MSCSRRTKDGRYLSTSGSGEDRVLRLRATETPRFFFLDAGQGKRSLVKTDLLHLAGFSPMTWRSGRWLAGEEVVFVAGCAAVSLGDFCSHHSAAPRRNKAVAEFKE